jgi:hypothetical protein
MDCYKLVGKLSIAGFIYWLSMSVASAEGLKQFVVTVDRAAGEVVSASQLAASAGNNGAEQEYGVSMLEEFRAQGNWIQSFSAASISDIEAYLAALEVEPQSVIESAFIHTPESVDGPKAGEVREGHKVYMIERDIPGAGDLPQEMRDKIALASQGTIEKIGDGIEWDHSYVTSEGTFCVYRANDPTLIKEHAKMMEVPANPITEVEHIVRNFEFSRVSQ